MYVHAIHLKLIWVIVPHYNNKLILLDFKLVKETLLITKL